jgi:hypothetical protein
MATSADRSVESEEVAGERLANLVWVTIYRFGPLSHEKLREHVPATDAALEDAIERLLGDGRVATDDNKPKEYTASGYDIPHGVPAGWEAAVFDHYQAMVTALCIKLRGGEQVSAAGDIIGGSTYAFDVWQSHPMYDEVSGLLRRYRDEAVGVLSRLKEYNEHHTIPKDSDWERFTTYVGQSWVAERQMEEE